MGKIYVTGLGPGAADQMTQKARKVLEHCPVIVGYTVYIDLIREDYPDKRYLSTPMRHLRKRKREMTWPWCAAATQAFTAWPG